MNQIYRLDDAIRVADARYERDRNRMYTNLLMLEIQGNVLEIERRDAQLRNDQLRIARETRLRRAPLATLRATIGGLMITAGLRVRGASPRSMETLPAGTR